MVKSWSMVQIAGLVVACGMAVSAADWAQWRGPNRDGVSASKTLLAEAWGENGPKQVWRTEKLLGGGQGGWASVSVAEGRVYLYLNAKSRVPIETRTLDERGLRRLGWQKEMPPADVVKAVEAARTSKERQELRQWKEVDQWRRAWVEEHLSEEQSRWRGFALDRLSRGSRAIPLELNDTVATIKDREFASAAELDKWFEENKIDGEVKKTIMQAIPGNKDVADDVVMCFNATDGTTVWKVGLPGRAHGWPCSCTPCVVDGRCYVAGSDANIYCLDAKTGEKMWQAKSKGNPAQNDASSFAVVDGVAVLISGPVAGYDAKTGETLWTTTGLSGNHNSAALWQKGGKTYVVCNTNRDIGCVDPKTGSVLWKVPGGGWSTVAIDGDTMVVYSSHGRVGVSAYKLSLEKAEKLWTQSFTDRGASPVIHDGHVYVIGGRGNSRAMCIRIEDGEAAWEQKMPGTEISSPVVADGKILAVVGSSLHLLRATPDKYTELAKANLGIETCTSPAVVDGKVYLRLGGAVACYDLTKPGM